MWVATFPEGVVAPCLGPIAGYRLGWVPTLGDMLGAVGFMAGCPGWVPWLGAMAKYYVRRRALLEKNAYAAYAI